MIFAMMFLFVLEPLKRDFFLLPYDERSSLKSFKIESLSSKPVKNITPSEGEGSEKRRSQGKAYKASNNVELNKEHVFSAIRFYEKEKDFKKGIAFIEDIEKNKGFDKLSYKDFLIVKKLWFKYNLGDKKSLNSLLKILNKNDTDSGVRALILWYIGKIFYDRGDFFSSMDYFYKLVELYPQYEYSDDANYYIARFFDRNNDRIYSYRFYSLFLNRANKYENYKRSRWLKFVKERYSYYQYLSGL